jgi:hypothetical protein
VDLAAGGPGGDGDGFAVDDQPDHTDLDLLADDLDAPREETRRCPVIGPAGPDERAAARRAPRSPSRPAGGTGQGIVRSSIQRGQRWPSGCRPCAA